MNKNGPRNFELRASDEDDTRVDIPLSRLPICANIRISSFDRFHMHQLYRAVDQWYQDSNPRLDSAR
ncbi:hypothetical protein TNCV_3533111 [Trichonephila clavipes]|nr:hypothetical protein TNCV_3533111 [Trichonephila clavipes]